MLGSHYARLAAVAVALVMASFSPAKARLSVWNLKLGDSYAALPDWEEFKGYACGTNGGPASIKLGGWQDFRRCRPEASGYREVYFEYDDEQEYIDRAQGLVNRLTGDAGTIEGTFPVVASALFDEAGVLRGVRLVTDPRWENRPDDFYVQHHPREEGNLLGTTLSARYEIDPKTHCETLPPAPGETPVGDQFVKLDCAKDIPAKQISVFLQVRLLRRPGESGRNPFLETQLTKGQFESTTRLEVFQLGYQPKR
ncbi:MAG: hypothetical protein U1E56_10575 [Bauldia sp.]